MAIRQYDVDTFHHYNGKNWLGSEVGAVKKTTQVDGSTKHVIENDRKIVKSGTYVTSPQRGLILDDVDVTDGSAEASVLIRGSYIDANLPESVASYATVLVAQGLYPYVEGGVVRPNFGKEIELIDLTIGTPTASNGTISWTAVTNAVGYELYHSDSSTGNFAFVADVAANSYKATKVGYYKVKAVGDHLVYGDSALSTAVNVATLA